MRRLSLLVALLLAGPAVAEELPGTSFSFGTWRGGAVADADGAFSHCYATLSFLNGDQFWVNVTRAEVVEVIFSFKRMSFSKDQSFDASLMLEVGLPTHGKAFALDQTIVSFNLKPVQDAHVFLSQGNSLRLTGVGNDEAYEVRGLGGVLGLVRSCAEKHRE